MRTSSPPSRKQRASHTAAAVVPSPSSSRAIIVVKVAFFLSGAAALFYQIIWLRLLSTFFGNTTLALSICLTAFMSGLALGSYCFGRWAAHHTRPFRLYALLEIIIGLYGALSPQLIYLVREAYLALARHHSLESPFLITFQFLACFFVLLIPTALMGGTLPILSKGVVRRLEHVGEDIAWLYGINTFGAATGALLVGFFLLPIVGLQLSVLLAALLNLSVGLAVLRIQLPEETAPAPTAPLRAPKTATTTPISSRLRTILIIGFGLSGFAGLALEVAWGRALCVYTGSSVYAFAAVLLAVLLGIALGSVLVPKFAARKPITLSWFAVIEVGAGLATLLMVLGYNYLPVIFYGIVQRWNNNYTVLLALEVMSITAFMLIPTMLAGASFPVITRLSLREGSAVSRHIGFLYSANTLGCILGSFLTGFVLIPEIGIRATVLLCAALYLAVGAAVAFSLSSRSRIWATASLAVLPLSLFLLPSWRYDLMTVGIFDAGLYAPDILDEAPPLRIIYYKEGTLCTVSVLEFDIDEGNGKTRLARALKVNAKADASLGADSTSQAMVGQLPMLLADHPQSVLVVGLGSGATAGTVGLHPVSRIDCVEIEPAVAEAAKYFTEINHNILHDPRFHLIFADARNYLAATPQRYDVITSEPSNPWVAGVSSLFTVEHFEACRKALAEDGLICQWLHLYSMAPEDAASIIASFIKVFPETTMWGIEPAGADMVLIARKRPWKVNYPALVNRIQSLPKVRADLYKREAENPLVLLSSLLRGPEDLRQLSLLADLNTDDLPRLEFSAPRNLYRQKATEQNLSYLSHFASQPTMSLVDLGTPWTAPQHEALGDTMMSSFFVEPQKIMPTLPWARREFETAAAQDPTNPEYVKKLGMIELVMEDKEAARRHLQKALALDPKDAAVKKLLASIDR